MPATALPTAARASAITPLRWLFALSLVCFHACVLLGRGFFWPVKGHAIVSVFFVLSGMLSYEGLMARPGTRRFWTRRVRRIFPTYAAVIIAAVAALSLLSTLAPADYFAAPQTWKYLFSNLFFLNFLEPELPGVFTGHAVSAVNSSLWTMKVEVAFYAVLPAIVWLARRFRSMRVVAIIYVLSAIYYIAFTALAVSSAKRGDSSGFYDMLRHQLPGQLMYFAAGMAAAELRPVLLRHRAAALLAGTAVWAVCAVRTELRPIEPLAIAAALTAAAYGFPRLSQWGARVPNLTYEVYLLHFPLLQSLIALGFFRVLPFAAAFALSLAIIIALAAALHAAVRKG